MNIHFNFPIVLVIYIAYLVHIVVHLFIYFSLVYHLLFLCSPHSLFTYSPFMHRFICTLVLRLFSICFLSPSVHSLSYVCFSFVVIYFTLILYILLTYSPFVFHLSCIYFPFILQVFSLRIYFSAIRVRGQSTNIVLSYESIFPSKYPLNRRMDVDAKRKVFPERLCDLLLPQGSCCYPNRNACCGIQAIQFRTHTNMVFNVFAAFPFEPILNQYF